MFKKIFPVVLFFLMCCSLSVTAFSQEECSHAEGNDVSNGDAKPAFIDVTSLSPGIIITDAELIIASNCVQTTTVDSEYLAWLLGAPEGIISSSTPELLKYFLQSPFMGQQVYSCSSTLNNEGIDFSCHEAFRELISREDFAEELEHYAESILYGPISDELDKTKFEKLLVQPLVKSLVSDLTDTAASYPYLQSIYTTPDIVPSAVGDLVGTINNIQ